jgi:hypothetical protein
MYVFTQGQEFKNIQTILNEVDENYLLHSFLIN